MFAHIYNFWQILKGNLWFLPALTCAFYAALTLGVYQAESHYFRDLHIPSIFFNGTMDDAKAISVTLLSSMITMTTLAISMTMVVLSLAASQLGPRLIRTFMSDQRTKIFIALFFGAVVACFVLMLIMHDATPKDFTPRLTVTAIVAICFANLFVLLAFVHHVALSSIADQIIIKVANDLHGSLERLTVSEKEEANEEPDLSVWPDDFDDNRQRLYFERSGYVQHIDYEQILTIAQEHDLYIRIMFKAGHFLVEQEDGVRVYPKNKLDDELRQKIRHCFIIGQTRTPTQDIEYSIRHLVEIGLRAQSPGQDDSFTAVTVLDRLSAAMAILFQKHTPSEWLVDSNAHVRVWAKQSDDADIIFSAFDQMRQSGRDKPDIIMHILLKLKILCELACTPSQVEGLKRQVEAIEFDLEHVQAMVHTIEEHKRLCQNLRGVLKEKKSA